MLLVIPVEDHWCRQKYIQDIFLPGLSGVRAGSPLGNLQSTSPFCCCCLAAESCSNLYDLVDCSPRGPSVHGISQARILEWVAIPFSTTSPAHPTNTLAPPPQPHASPVSPRSLGAREGWPELLVVPGGPGVAAVGVSLAGTPPEGVSPVWECSRQSLSP